MYEGNEFLKQNATQKTNLYEVQLSEAKLDRVKPEGVNTPDGLIFLGSLALVMGWAVIFFKVSKSGTVARDDIFVKLKLLHGFPCRNCQFFSNTAYLKCAVNPSLVLSAKAIDCPDYKAKNKKFSH
jgi:hypothetical protein